MSMFISVSVSTFIFAFIFAFIFTFIFVLIFTFIFVLIFTFIFVLIFPFILVYVNILEFQSFKTFLRVQRSSEDSVSYHSGDIYSIQNNTREI